VGGGHVTIKKCFLALVLTACGVAGASPLTVADFDKLPPQEQDRILDATKTVVSVTLFFAQEGEGGSKRAAEFSRCLRDRDVDWLRKSLRQYFAEFGPIATSIGAAVAHALAWKCCYLRLEKPPL